MTIKHLTDSPSSIAFGPLPQDDPRRRCPDLAKAQRLLDYAPSVALQEGLGRTIAWFVEAVRSQAAPGDERVTDAVQI
jgi:UDP-glucuronate decarboxylase